MSKATTYLEILDKISDIVKKEMKDFEKLTSKQKVRNVLTDVNNYILFRGKLNKESMSNKPVDKKTHAAWQTAELTNMERARTKIRTFTSEEYHLYIEALEKKLQDLDSNASGVKKLDVYEYINAATSFCMTDDLEIQTAIKNLRENNGSTLTDGMLR